MTRLLRSPVPWLLGAVLLAGPLAAQGEKITLNLRPAPNQVIRAGMTQRMAFDMTAEGLPNGPMKIEGLTALQGIQRIGAPDAQGIITGEFTIDSVTMDMLLNGSPMPVLPMESLKGQTVAVSFDSTGKLLDVKGTAENETMLSAMKNMIGRLVGSLPNATLAIGDTVSAPLSMAIPIPNLGLGTQTNLEGRSRFKLVAIGRDGSDRIATLELATEATMSGSVDMHMTGSGSMQWNVEKGFVKTGNNDMKVEMTMTLPGAGAMHMSGTILMTMTGESRAP